MSDLTCHIYRCSAKTDMYIYLAEKDNFDALPDVLRKNLGTLEFTLELTLDRDKKLACEDPVKVMENLKNQGFHLQMPAEMPVDQLLEKIAKETLNQQDK